MSFQKVTVDGKVAKEILDLLVRQTSGPDQAQATLCLTMLRLYEYNQQITNQEVDIKKLTDDLTVSIHSIREAGSAIN